MIDEGIEPENYRNAEDMRLSFSKPPRMDGEILPCSTAGANQLTSKQAKQRRSARSAWPIAIQVPSTLALTQIGHVSQRVGYDTGESIMVQV